MVYQFPPAVEQWRPLVEKYFPPHLVGKALWTIEKESSGNPRADNGAAVGLFQIERLPGRPDPESLKDPEANVRYAALELGAAGGDFSPWGENNSYNGQPFGAFGYNQYPGDAAFGGAFGSGPVNGRSLVWDLSNPAPQNQMRPASWSTYTFTQGFGPTDEKLDSGYTDENGVYHPNFNLGYDYGMPVGTPIDATTGGKVVAVDDQGSRGWGLSVKIQDAEGNIHNYGHLSAANVNVGDVVGAGTIIGASGNTGASTGPHLSYDVRRPDGFYIDPGRFVNGEGAVYDNYQALELPFDYATYLTKSARYKVLEAELAKWEADYQAAVSIGAEPPPMPSAQLEEFGRLEAELNEYDSRAAEGGQSFDDYIRGLEYRNASDPRLIDAQNAAGKAARQLQINQAAQTKTSTDMQEQRLGQDAAETSTANWRASSAFSSPMGFRVGSTDLPTEEEVFAKNIGQISKNVPDYVDIPYPQQMSAFGAPKPPSTGNGANFTPVPSTPGGGVTIKPWNATPSWSEEAVPSGGYTPTTPSSGPSFGSAFSTPAPPRTGPVLTPSQQYWSDKHKENSVGNRVGSSLGGALNRFAGSILGRF